MAISNQGKPPISLLQNGSDITGRLALASLVIEYIEGSSGSSVDLTQATLSPEKILSLRQASKATLDSYAEEAIESFKTKYGSEVYNSALSRAIIGSITDPIRAQTAEISNLDNNITIKFGDQNKLIARSTHWVIQLAVSVLGGFLFGFFVYVAKLLPSPF